MLIMETLAQRLKREMDRLGLKQEDLAQKAGVSQSLIHKLVTGKARESRKISKLAVALGVNTDWLANGGDYTNELSIKNGLSLSSQINKAGRRIPLIELKRAGAWKEAIKNHTPGVGDIMVLHDVGGNAFATIIDSDSMEPKFQEGDTILIDPDIAPEHKKFVVALVGGDVIFRQYWREAGKCMLKPLNTRRYDDIPVEDAVIIGVATKKYIIEDLL